MIVVSPDKFKGSLTATEVAAVIAEAFAKTCRSQTVMQLPIADGGDGTVAMALRLGMKRVDVVVCGPLGGSVKASYARGDKVAVIEMAAAAGLASIKGSPNPHTAASAQTYGVGQLIVHAISEGAQKLIIGLGGSASTDGGIGLVRALGALVAGDDGSSGGGGLQSVTAVDFGPMCERLEGVEVVLASDVDIPLCGPDGAAAVFGPQKGADPALVAHLDASLAHWADVVEHATGVDARNLPGAGAAGGAGFPLLASGMARLESGGKLMMELSAIEESIQQSSLLVVGEGKLDHQSLRGKGPVAAAMFAQSVGVPVVAVVGINELDDADLRRAGIDRVYAMTDVEPDPRICLLNAHDVLCKVADRMASNECGRVREAEVQS